ncbi:hypothetical protein [Thalassomonas haliotis]|uniref:Transposase n=1 Tax=Thalassomonas haliotis TaxID=485448 RepID=A0ABY7VFG7_9GAMM|nr:hypothetical protein [Thalassomonas haliotis]WDE11756.1 hypothetical protein H3N35_26785 [Thalassomonas haliotis]
MRISALPCINGHLPKVNMLGKSSYVMVCQKSGCNCLGQAGMKPQKSYHEAILEWNKFTPVHTTVDLYHPTVRVKGLPLREAWLNLTVERMFIDKFLTFFSCDDLMADDREVFIIRQKWLELLSHQLNLLADTEAVKNHQVKVKKLSRQARQKQCKKVSGQMLNKAFG